jgi:DNA-binding response OmpR family regulator
MLFGKRERLIRRILIVEDEPLVAFDNEHMLQEAGYEVVATVDSFADAAEMIAAEQIDLVLTDLSLSGDGDGLDVARAAKAKGVAVLFVTGHSTEGEAQGLALGCLAKPYSERVLLGTLEAVDRHIQGVKRKKLPGQLTLYAQA